MQEVCALSKCRSIYHVLLHFTKPVVYQCQRQAIIQAIPIYRAHTYPMSNPMLCDPGPGHKYAKAIVANLRLPCYSLSYSPMCDCAFNQNTQEDRESFGVKMPFSNQQIVSWIFLHKVTSSHPLGFGWKPLENEINCISATLVEPLLLPAGSQCWDLCVLVVF